MLTRNVSSPIYFADSFKIQYMQFMAYMKTPQYKASLQQLLEQEKVGRISNIPKQSCLTTTSLRCRGEELEMRTCAPITSAAPGQLHRLCQSNARAE